MSISNLPKLSPKFLLPFPCHFPTAPSKTNPIPFNLPTLQLTQTKTHFGTEKMSSVDASGVGGGNGGGFDQNMLVMRHGDRMDNFLPTWITTAERPWDPPLIDAGKVRAYKVGNEIRTRLGFPIHRVFVSPFLRCIQTASEVISAICSSSDDSFDPTKVKV